MERFRVVWGPKGTGITMITSTSTICKMLLLLVQVWYYEEVVMVSSIKNPPKKKIRPSSYWNRGLSVFITVFWCPPRPCLDEASLPEDDRPSSQCPHDRSEPLGFEHAND